VLLCNESKCASDRGFTRSIQSACTFSLETSGRYRRYFREGSEYRILLRILQVQAVIFASPFPFHPFGGHLTTRLEFRFRLNGEIMPELFVQRAMVDGERVGQWEIEVDVDGIGKFTIDDNSNLWDGALTQFVLEFRDETSWALIPQANRWASKDKGWQRVTPQELVEILESEGLISTEQV
jgi:hypothetical protein